MSDTRTGTLSCGTRYVRDLAWLATVESVVEHRHAPDDPAKAEMIEARFCDDLEPFGSLRRGALECAAGDRRGVVPVQIGATVYDALLLRTAFDAAGWLDDVRVYLFQDTLAQLHAVGPGGRRVVLAALNPRHFASAPPLPLEES